jgi:HK97 family phage major capsid protein
MTIDELRAAIKAKAERCKTLWAAASAASRDLSADETAEIEKLVPEIKSLTDELTGKRADADLRAKFAALDLPEGDAPPATEATPEQVAAGMKASRGRKTLGSRFIEDPAYAALMKLAPNGTFAKGQVIISDHVRVKTLVTGASDTSGGALIVNDFIGLQTGLELFQRPLTVRDLLTQSTTSGDTVEYVRVTSTTNNAATVAESTTTATPGSPSPATGVKPESALALAKFTALVRQFAHWIPATTRALADAGQIRTLIDAFLAYGIEEELEDQIVNGDAAGEDFDGLTHVSGTQSQAFDTDMLTTIRKAITKVRVTGRSKPSAILLSPADWETIDLLQDNNARFFFGGPTQLGTPTVWGLPVVQSEALTAGTAIVADFRKAILWDRQDASLQVSNQHADFFIRNMIAILAEARYAFGVIQPSAFVIVDTSA